MSFLTAFLITNLLSAGHITASITPTFGDGQVQPGCYDPPAIPSEYINDPQRWRDVSPIPTIAPRQIGNIWHGWENVQYLFTFGDSYTSTGFDIHGSQPNTGNPLGNPAYPGKTSSNGPNYIDFLATTYNESYIQTYNFGYGGATIDPNVIGSPYGMIVQSFRQQVLEEFISVYANNPNVPWTDANSLFTIFFGINDIMLSYANRNSNLNSALIEAYESIVNQLYTAGARNFLFMNVPPIDRSPSTLALSAATQASQARYIGDFNFRLIALVYNLGLRYSDTTTWLFDTNWLFTQLLNNGPDVFQQTAGYTNVTGYCEAYSHGTPTLTYFDPSCDGPVSDYLWLNNLHPTYPMHNLVASQIIQQITR